jgi:hypothetical protein
MLLANKVFRLRLPSSRNKGCCLVRRLLEVFGLLSSGVIDTLTKVFDLAILYRKLIFEWGE